MYCPRCRVEKLNGRFCSACGVKLDKIPTCGYCGTEIWSTAKYCSGCGKKKEDALDKATSNESILKEAARQEEVAKKKKGFLKRLLGM